MCDARSQSFRFIIPLSLTPTMRPGAPDDAAAAWPTIFVLDKSGRVRWTHVPAKARMTKRSRWIQKLLAESDSSTDKQNQREES